VTAPAPGPGATGAQAAAAAGAPRAHDAKRHPLVHAAAATSVAIQDFSFGPSSVTVHAGDTVTWSNQGQAPHTATGSGFDTGTLNHGQSGSHTFTTAGTFSYHCTIHPFMKGTVTVLAASGSTGSGSSTSGSSGSSGTSGSGANGSGSGAGSAGSTTATGSASAQALPHTGLDVLPLAVLGAVLLLSGIALRRRTRLD
jgi:plastocyanin